MSKNLYPSLFQALSIAYEWFLLTIDMYFHILTYYFCLKNDETNLYWVICYKLEL